MGAALPDVLISVSAQVLAPLRDAIAVARRLAEEAESEATGAEGDAEGGVGRLSHSASDSRVSSPGWGREHGVIGTYAASLRSMPHGTHAEIDAVRERLLLEDAARHFQLGRLPDAFAQLANRAARSAAARARDEVCVAAASRQFLRAGASARYAALAIWRSFAMVRRRHLVVLPHMRPRLDLGLQGISRRARANEAAARAARRWRCLLYTSPSPRD